MKIYIIPFDQDPRRRAATILTYRQPPAINNNEYPPLPNSKSVTTAIATEVDPDYVSYAALVRGPPILFEHIRYGGGLPVELRQMIWENAMRGEEYVADSRYYTLDRHLIDPVQIRNYHTGRIERPKFLPSVCFLMKGTMLEVTHVFIEKSTFMVASYPGNCYLQDWLKTVQGMGRVRSLQFDFFDCFPSNIAVNSDLELAARCTGLTKIRMGFHWRAIGHYDLAEELLPRYQLQQLFECRKIEQVIFEAKGCYHANTQYLLERLGALIVAKFAEKGRQVTFKIV